MEEKNRVIRGGSWFSWPRRARSAYRNRARPGNRGSLVGLRIVRGESCPAKESSGVALGTTRLATPVSPTATGSRPATAGTTSASGS